MLSLSSVRNRRKHMSGGGGGGGGGGGDDAFVASSDVANVSAAVTIIFGTSGTVTFVDDGLNSPYDWLVSGLPTAFEIRATLISGNSPGTMGTWLSLGTVARSWGYTDSGSSKSCLMTVEIRRTSDFVVVGSGSVSLTYDSGA